VTLEELKGARTRALATFTYYRDSLQGPALLFGRALCSGFDIDYLENRAGRLEKITIDDVNDAADTVFRSSDLPVTGVMLPAEPPKMPPRSTAPKPSAAATAPAKEGEKQP
jgi:predicted Zn-dependent peptidase